MCAPGTSAPRSCCKIGTLSARSASPTSPSTQIGAGGTQGTTRDGRPSLPSAARVAPWAGTARPGGCLGTSRGPAGDGTSAARLGIPSCRAATTTLNAARAPRGAGRGASLPRGARTSGDPAALSGRTEPSERGARGPAEHSERLRAQPRTRPALRAARGHASLSLSRCQLCARAPPAAPIAHPKFPEAAAGCGARAAVLPAARSPLTESNAQLSSPAPSPRRAKAAERPQAVRTGLAPHATRPNPASRTAPPTPGGRLPVSAAPPEPGKLSPRNPHTRRNVSILREEPITAKPHREAARRTALPAPEPRVGGRRASGSRSGSAGVGLPRAGATGRAARTERSSPRATRGVGASASPGAQRRRCGLGRRLRLLSLHAGASQPFQAGRHVAVSAVRQHRPPRPPARPRPAPRVPAPRPPAPQAVARRPAPSARAERGGSRAAPRSAPPPLPRAPAGTAKPRKAPPETGAVHEAGAPELSDGGASGQGLAPLRESAAGGVRESAEPRPERGRC